MRKKPDFARKKNFLTIADFTKKEIEGIIELAFMLKEADRQGVQLPLLKNKVLAMMFSEPSTRTRVSFETAMTQLGGHAEFISTSTLHVGAGHETMRDTAEIISRMTDGAVLRTGAHEAIEAWAEYAFTPTIDGCSAGTIEGVHPTQVIADVMTMREHLPDKKWEEITVMCLGDLNLELDGFGMVARSIGQICAILGMNFIACSPNEMMITEKDVKEFKELAKGSGAKIITTTDPYEYISQVDFTVSDAFYYAGLDSPEFKERRLKLLYPKYMVDQNLVEAGPAHLGVMHCLPGHRDVEITSEVWDGPNSLLFEEAENRLHAQKAICTWFLYEKQPSKELVDYHMGRIEAYLNSREF